MEHADTTYRFLWSSRLCQLTGGGHERRDRIKFRLGVNVAESRCQWIGNGIFWQDAEYSLYLNSNDDFLYFDNRANLADANDNYSGGVSFLGLCLLKSRRELAQLSKLSYRLLNVIERSLPATKHPSDLLNLSLQSNVFFGIYRANFSG